MDELEMDELFQRFAGCIREIIVEAHKYPNDCLECIANDAILSFRLPLEVYKNDDSDIIYDVVYKK